MPRQGSFASYSRPKEFRDGRPEWGAAWRHRHTPQEMLLLTLLLQVNQREGTQPPPRQLHGRRTRHATKKAYVYSLDSRDAHEICEAIAGRTSHCPRKATARTKSCCNMHKYYNIFTFQLYKALIGLRGTSWDLSDRLATRHLSSRSLVRLRKLSAGARRSIRRLGGGAPHAVSL